MMPLLPPDPLGIPAPAYILEVVYIASTALFSLLFELTLGCAVLLAVQRVLPSHRFLSAVIEHRLRNALPLIALGTLATLITPLVMWYALFGTSFPSGAAPLGASWTTSLTGGLGAMALAGLFIATLGFGEERDEMIIKRGYRLFIAFMLARMVASALTITSAFAVLLTGFAVGTAVLGLMRPRNAAWLLSSACLTVLAHLAGGIAQLEAFKGLLAPLFYVEDLPVRWQIAPMILFFIGTAAAIAAVGMMICWISKPSACTRENPGRCNPHQNQRVPPPL